MRESALFSRIRRDSHYQIRSARNEDWPAIEKLLSYADRHYLALKWWTIQEWLGSPTFLLLTDRRERLMGLVLTIIGASPIAWFSAVVVAAESYLSPLVEASVQAVLAQGGTELAFLGNERWITSKLQEVGWEKTDQVITLRRRKRWPEHKNPADVQVQQATTADLDAIISIDHAAFEPMWWYSHEELRRGMNQAYCFDLAHLNDECVGYQFCTLRNGRGHIVRLAIHPRWWRHGIGRRLLGEAMTAFDQVGAESVTVNTQENNLASLNLYRRFGFERVRKSSWAVWFKSW